MHADLTRNPALTGEALSSHVHNHHVGSAHSALADTGGRDQQVFVVQANRKVPVGGSNKAIFVQHTAILHNFKSIFAVAGHQNLAVMVQHVSEALQEQAGQNM
jgi:hypothetical protein